MGKLSVAPPVSKAPLATKRRKTFETVTLADVAKAAEVAPMTVSRYLNHHPSISEKTSRKIRAAISKLGYAPNYAARMLMGQPSNVIGLIVPSLAHPFYSEIAHTVQESARARGYLVWIAASDSAAETEATVIKQMKLQRVDGILLVPSSHDHGIYATSDGPPVVTIDQPVPGLSAVLIDNRKSSRDAVEHLIKHGRKRIACLAGEGESFTMSERVAGYRDAVQAHSLKPILSTSCNDVGSTAKIIRELLSAKQAIDAIFFLNSVIMTDALRVLEEMKVSVPGKLSLLGFDDFDLADVVRPGVSAIRQPARELGKCAARLLFERLTSEEGRTPVTTLLPASLILRNSCGCERRTGEERTQGVAYGTAPLSHPMLDRSLRESHSVLTA